MSMSTIADTEQRYADDVEVGQALPTMERRPTTVQIFRYSGVTWNSHRIHYDKDYTASEGYPDVLVQSHLHGAFLTSLVDGYVGEAGRIVRLYYSVRRFATPGDVLTLEGDVVDVKSTEGGATVSLEIREVRKADDTVCVQGNAEVFLPSRTASGDRKA
jgi:hydroxyacyl-ACP dehydratase HTD2-like protein with hotdog domain